MELFVEGKDLVDLDFFSVSDPICTLSTKESNLPYATWKDAGETEVIDNNLNPKWIKHFCVWFIFIRDIELWFKVWNYNQSGDNDLIGEVKLSLSQLMLAKGQSQTLTLTLSELKKGGKQIKNRDNRGSLTIRADKIKKTEDIIKFQISANLQSKKFLCFGSDAPYLQIERARQNEDRQDMVKVFRTPTAHDEIKPWWEPTTLFMTEFCNNNKQLPIRISVKNYVNAGTHKVYG